MTQPILCVIVQGDPARNGRALWVADAAARGGWSVTLLGQAGDSRRSEVLDGSVRILRVPLRRTLQTRLEREPAPVRGQLAGFLRAPGGSIMRRYRPGSPVTVRETVWRHDMPLLDDLWLSFRDELRRLQPDLVHAAGATTVGIAARYVGDVRLRGEGCSWVYDAMTLTASDEARVAALRQHEAEFIGRADAMIADSERSAEQLRRRHSLQEGPPVIAVSRVTRVLRRVRRWWPAASGVGAGSAGPIESVLLAEYARAVTHVGGSRGMP